MMRAPIHAVDDGIGGAFQFVVQTRDTEPFQTAQPANLQNLERIRLVGIDPKTWRYASCRPDNKEAHARLRELAGERHQFD
ncbi:hypothetical protein [Acetobacter sp. DmW_136]|uniref:hypothetical protein n=1 Tax=Acetobacter sp. DmW_136 TaxID=2591091 RepID=UPI00351AE1C4